MISVKESVTVIQSLTKEYIDENIEEMLKDIGSNIEFSSNVWSCDKLGDYSGIAYTERLCFEDIDEKYIDYLKYFVIVTDVKLNTLKTYLGCIKQFFKYLVEYENNIELKKVDSLLIDRYRKYVNNKDLAKSTKVKRLQVIAIFFWTLHGWDEMPKDNPVNKRVHLFKRTKQDNKPKTKYIPEEIVEKLDKIFYQNDIPVHYRLYYWLSRLYPSRGCELSSLKLDCIKPFNQMYVYFKPEEKSSNSFGESKQIDIYMKYEGIEKYVIDLYQEQKNISLNLQKYCSERFKGLLFLYNPASSKGGIQNRITLLDGIKFNIYLKKVCIKNNIGIDEKNTIKIIPHSFRHNAITDRLYNKFSTTSIRDLSGHLCDSTMINSYLYSKEDEKEKMQKRVLRERFTTNNYQYIVSETKVDKIEEKDNKVELPKSKVIFRGRIMNLDEKREQRLLANKRAYQISYSDKCIGICTEIASCRSGIFNCLGCDDFAADASELDYFKEQMVYWEEKAEYFDLKGNQFQLQQAIETRNLFKRIVERIESIV